MLKIGVLGRVSYENRMLIAAAGTPFAKIDGFFSAKDPVKFGSSGRIDSMGDAASIFCRATNVPCKLITGYKGSSEVSLALLRGEVNAQVTSESQTAKLVKGGKIVAVAVLAPNTAPLLPQAKSIFDLVKLNPEQDKWLRFRAGVSDVGRTLVVPDGLPAERLALLRKAVREIMTDKNFVAAAEKARRPIAYAPPEESENIIKGIFAKLSAKERTDIKELLLKAY
jgi:tripartite-type tricarboxylate transporter receptor subunit TctC